jgi:diacylglycerol O-acyltransferase / wax synthase
MLLYSETPNLHTHTLKVAVIDASRTADFAGEFNFEAFRRHLSRVRKLLLRYDGQADRPIIASVPTVTDKSDRVTGNEISGLSISLPVHVADPAERARLVALATQIAKEDHEILGPRIYGQLMAYLPTAIAPAAFRWLGHRDAPNKIMNVAVSSVAGPRERGHFGGAPVSEIYSTGVLSPGAPVNITVWSYVDQLGVAVLTDDQTFNDPHDATDALIDAFAELRSTAGLCAHGSKVDLAAEHALR